MHLYPFLSFVFILFLSSQVSAQNYLRVSDPDAWGAPASNTPEWYNEYSHGTFEEVTISAAPQGIFTEVEIYATISHSPDVWSWGDDLEVIWQFDLPANTIVHDAWLWVGQDIIKADIVDFWTALETYTGIVDYNEDPLFFYQLSDKRYELRIYPLNIGDVRKIKVSFLVPSIWDTEKMTQGLLQNIFQSTDYPPPYVELVVPVDDTWGEPTLYDGANLLAISDTVTGGTGDLLHYLNIDGEDFIDEEKMELVFDAPYSDDNSFLSIYEDDGEQFYQFIYAPDWQEIIQDSNPEKSLIILNYDESRTSLTKEDFLLNIQGVLEAYFTAEDQINVALSTEDGIQFLGDEWWTFDEVTFVDLLNTLSSEMTTGDFSELLHAGFEWAQGQSDISKIYLLAANEDLAFPPLADDAFATLSNVIPEEVPFELFDYQDENVSTIFYDGQEYSGNEYFYQLIENSFVDSDITYMRENSGGFYEQCEELFPPFMLPTGLLDFNTSLENGVNYQEYNIGSLEYTPESSGVMMQTGKYIGDFPMNIYAELISNNGDYWTLSESLTFDEVHAGDTLMREIWYGPHLKNMEALLASDDEREYLIEQSIQERILTGLTAFLALEPSLGGEPCIDCLFNNGDIIIIDAVEQFDLRDATVLVTPNPASDIAHVFLSYPAELNPQDWNAVIYDAAGRMVSELQTPLLVSQDDDQALVWKWDCSLSRSGLYFVKIQGEYGERMEKIIVLH